MTLPELMERNVCWLMNVTDEYAKAEEAMNHVRRAYPLARRVMIVDGPGYDEPRWADIALRVGARCIVGRSNLYALQHGGEVVERLLRCGLWHLFAFKIDPDTIVWRKLNHLPNPLQPTVFGTVQESAGRRSIQGGCVGWTRAAALKLTESGLLMGDELKVPRTWTNGEPTSEARARRGLTSFDWCMGWACTKLGIPMVQHAEIVSLWNQPPPGNHDLRLAVTHPHK